MEAFIPVHDGLEVFLDIVCIFDLVGPTSINIQAELIGCAVSDAKLSGEVIGKVVNEKKKQKQKQ